MGRKGSWHSHISPYSREDEVAAGGISRSLSKGSTELESLPPSALHPYTKGVDVTQTNISGAGEVSLWEFSGEESYYSLFDHFIGNTHCIHVVVYNCADPIQTQIQQTQFWLTFLQSRIPPVEPLGDEGKSHKPAYVMLIGTHADQSHARKNSAGEFSSPTQGVLKEKIMERFGRIFNLEESFLLLDANLPSSPGIKALKATINTRKQNIIEGLPRLTQFLESVLTEMADWRQALNPFPVVTWTQFIAHLHDTVNPLAGDEHLKEIIQQLR